jgi:5-methylcytosine-specific restriction protein B
VLIGYLLSLDRQHRRVFRSPHQLGKPTLALLDTLTPTVIALRLRHLIYRTHSETCVRSATSTRVARNRLSLMSMATTDSVNAVTEIILQGRSLVSASRRETGIKRALDLLFEDRYHARNKPKDGFRDAYGLTADDGVPWAGIIAEDNATSGPYGGASLAWFPLEEGSIFTFVVGTRGLAPDEGLLTRPGHARRTSALRRYLTRLGVAAWSKSDPAAINVDIPETGCRLFPTVDAVFKRYGREIYCAADIPSDLDLQTARAVVQAFLDLYAYERSWDVRADRRAEVAAFLGPLRNSVFPDVTADTVNDLLRERKFVVIQGPPGTGKTRMAEAVREHFFANRGRTVQFHPAVTYEDFVIGLAPVPEANGLRFAPRRGWLLEAARDAADQPYALIIDEISRGDLGKVLGEAIYLFEPREVGTVGRQVTLPHMVDGQGTFKLPDNLYVLGTMNTADRSIASVDLAVRRRFAFVTLMPDRRVVENLSIPEAVIQFDRVAEVFIEHATDDMLDLMPGHSYYLATDEAQFRQRMQYDLLPLLDEYLRQGLVGAMSSELRAARDQIDDDVHRP